MKVAIYVRVSTLEQAEEGYSIDEQIDKLTKFCEVKNWTVGKVYKDGGFSGSSIERPGMKSLIIDIKRNYYDTVLVYKLDRLSRSQKDTLYLIEDVFQKYNVGFVSLSENFDTNTPFGKAMIGILAVFAQLEREQIKERMQMGKIGRAKSGKAMGWTMTPFGYRYKDGNYYIEPLEAEIVKQIFNDYLSGLSITKLKDKLNDQGHIAKKIPWSYRTIRQTLDNPTYAGFTKYKNQIFPGNHKAIVSEKIYNNVQKELEIRQKKAYEKNNNPRPFQAKYMVSGLIRCGVCGATFEVCLGMVRKDGSRRRYYKCLSRTTPNHNATMYKNPNGCTSKNYDLPVIEQAVLSQIQKIKDAPERINTTENKKETLDLSSYYNRLEKINQSIEKIVDLYLDNSIDKSILEKRQEKFDIEKKNIENKINEIVSNKAELSVDDTMDILSKFDDVSELAYDEQKKLVRSLISQIKIYPNKLEIKWKFAV